MAMNTEMLLTPLSLKRQIAGVVVGERGGGEAEHQDRESRNTGRHRVGWGRFI